MFPMYLVVDHIFPDSLRHVKARGEIDVDRSFPIAGTDRLRVIQRHNTRTVHEDINLPKRFDALFRLVPSGSFCRRRFRGFPMQ